MGINGDTTVNCIANIVNDSGQVTLATRDGQIYRYDRIKEKFVLISGNELHDGSTITEVDELCHLISNRQQATILAKVKTSYGDEAIVSMRHVDVRN